MTHNLRHGESGMKSEAKAAIGTCGVCFDNVFETEEYTRDRAVSGGIYLMHVDCHIRIVGATMKMFTVRTVAQIITMVGCGNERYL